MSLNTSILSTETLDYMRPATEVMRLARMGCGHPTRLSFLRVLLRRLASSDWKIDRPVWNVDANGVGHGVEKTIVGSSSRRTPLSLRRRA